MSESRVTTLEDYRVRMGAGRVILMLFTHPEAGVLGVGEVGMTADEARAIAADLIAGADRVESEGRR